MNFLRMLVHMIHMNTCKSAIYLPCTLNIFNRDRYNWIKALKSKQTGLVIKKAIFFYKYICLKKSKIQKRGKYDFQKNF